MERKQRDQILAIVNKNKYLIVVLLVLAFGFYWYELRPNQLKAVCRSEATTYAQNKVKESAEFARTKAEKAEEDCKKPQPTSDILNLNCWYLNRAERLENMVQEGRYFVADYEEHYEACLHRRGIEVRQK